MMEINSRNIKYLSYLGARGVLGQAVFDLAEEKKFYAVSADLGVGSGFSRFIEKCPYQFIDVGIAEQDMIAVAAGLASKDVPVITTSWATFASYRCADQIRCFLGLMRKNVKVVGMGSGLSNAIVGGSHYGISELAMLRAIPGIDVIAPCDGVEIYAAIEAVLSNDRPSYIWLTGGIRLAVINSSESYRFQLGKANQLREGRDVLIIGCGTLLAECMKAAELLEEKGISAKILNMHTIKPLDEEAIYSNLSCRLIVTVEEHNIIGGLGSAVAEVLSKIEVKPLQIRIGIEDFVPNAGEYGYLLESCGLTAEQIASRIETELKD